MKLNCSNEIITNRLAIHIDISDQVSWNLNTGFTSVSLNEWEFAKAGNADLLDFGLTEYDNGRVNDLLASAVTTPSDIKLTLYRVGYNNATGGTFYDLHSMSGITGSSTDVGNYFNLNGGYLQGYFKLQGEEYEVLPARFKDGITIETLLNIQTFNDGIFYMMGARAEDKYNPFFSGETEQIETTASTTIRTGTLGESVVLITTSTGFTGITTSNDDNLSAFIDTTRKKNVFAAFEDSEETVPIEQKRNDTWGNVIAFLLKSDGKLGVKQINENGIVKSNYSKNVITESGWTLINITFTPDKVILTKEDLKCNPRRKGTLTFYVDGRRFWQLKDFDEFMFKDFNNHKEKTYGVPYSISWGGGSFGLKHSWHWDKSIVGIYSGQSTSAITANFTSQNATLVIDDCNTLTATTSGVTFLANNTKFTTEDNCTPPNVTPITVFQIQHGTGATHHEFHYIEYNTDVIIFPNREYKFSMDVQNEGTFFQTNGEIYIDFIEKDKLEIISENKYNSRTGVVNGFNDVDITVKSKNQNTITTKVGIYIVAETQSNANNSWNVFVKNFEYNNLNDLVQDSDKQNLLIEQNFDSSFIGCIQKLRVYDFAFTSQEALHNAKAEQFSDIDYNILTNGGGRIIRV